MRTTRGPSLPRGPPGGELRSGSPLLTRRPSVIRSGPLYASRIAEAIALFREIVRQRAGHLSRVRHVDDMPGYEAGEPVGIDASRQVMPRRNGAEGARIVVEASRVINAGGLSRALAKPLHAFDGIVKPPGRAESQGGVMPGQRREFPGVGA